ncbi:MULTISPECIES: tetratricopeptide repeat protein [Elizabethkingia]|uniref:tetratricopeptide repeat protein n=1 Tax=Elizabethkingia TaxID=308865 RepID=UPI001907E92C|nr:MULTISPECIES: tetratricopeptide repeat protein [Elizabethkingia]QQM28203.1 hypothetical protein JCR23_07225 [Elizabethkingia sp. M8]CAH1145333.1 hypothetical protein EAVVTKC53_01930 [Elizabethkingia anophelis]CAI9679624.1 hypothetical protein EAVVTKC53_01061 [Elizabethkingia anophelis]
MGKIILIIFLSLFSYSIRAQINCEAFKYYGDTLQYKACKLVENIDDKYYQFSREFQEKYDKAIEICPYFSYGYKEKSVAYLKSGDFLTWKILIDKAVYYNKRENLGYRGWCRYQFFKDYQGAILDFEELEKEGNDIGFSSNGDYHLQIVKAICYSALGKNIKAIDIITKQMSKENYQIGLYDYYQLGVIYFQMKDYKNAVVAFEKQLEINPLAECIYYISKINKEQNNKSGYLKNKKLAIELYQKGKYLRDRYTHQFNKVYLQTMEQE